MKKPIEVITPCCNKTLKVTHRKAKMQERPRNHRCPECGKKYQIGPSYVLPHAPAIQSKR